MVYFFYAFISENASWSMIDGTCIMKLAFRGFIMMFRQYFELQVI